MQAMGRPRGATRHIEGIEVYDSRRPWVTTGSVEALLTVISRLKQRCKMKHCAVSCICKGESEKKASIYYKPAGAWELGISLAIRCKRFDPFQSFITTNLRDGSYPGFSLSECPRPISTYKFILKG
jgi:hypothetical protein